MMIPVDQVPAGAAMDAAVAEAMGWIKAGHPYNNEIEEWRWPPGEPDDFHLITREWTPSIDIAQALEMLDAYLSRGWEVNLEWADWNTLPNTPENKFWAVSFVKWGNDENDSKYNTAEADTAPLAICRAFLKAHGITEIEREGAQ